MDLIVKLFKEDEGRHFDPTLVRLFLDNLDEIIQIKTSYPNE